MSAVLSCVVCTDLQVHVRIDSLIGSIFDGNEGTRSSGTTPVNGGHDPGTRAPALYVVGQLCAFGEVLGLPARAPIVPASSSGCSWGSVLSFPLKVGSRCPHNAQQQKIGHALL